MWSPKSFRVGILAGTSATALAGYLWNQTSAKSSAPSSPESATFSSPSVNTLSFEEGFRIGRKLSRTEKSQTKSTIIQWDSNWDRRQPEMLLEPLKDEQFSSAVIEERKEKLKELRPKVTRRIILIRHGQYEYEFEEDEKRCLTTLGREQAEFTGQRLKKLLSWIEGSLVDKEGNPRPFKINLIKSTMTRAQETGNIILKEVGRDDINVQNCDLIREGAPISPEPPISSDLWNPDPRDFYEEGGRIEAGFRRYIKRADFTSEEEQIDVLVCHGNVIRYFLCRALQFPPEAWLRFALSNGSITTLHVRPNGRVSVTAVGESGHFPLDKLTYN